ncbi:unnamed protein product [Staurois parvus]|uniref:Uncharacterized protein n=1 Tax=Staurois parvus TaxID=386267 RepID=A0ABN9AG46_9NEOB|nr:unnamed protein product [Staurois parvus]
MIRTSYRGPVRRSLAYYCGAVIGPQLSHFTGSHVPCDSCWSIAASQ